jgi:O-antigen/teichoic acid export membrane protein
MNQTSVFKQLLSLSRDSIIYGLSVVVSQFVGFLLVPVYTNLLGTEGYGVIEVLSTTVAVLGIVLGMGFTTALLRFYSNREDEEGKRTVASTAVVILMATSLVALLVLELSAGPISSLIYDPKRDCSHDTTYFRIIFLSLFFNEGIAIALTVFRARREPAKYAIASVSQFLLAVTLNLVFVVGLHKGIVGVLYAELLTTACMYVVLMTSLLRRVGIRLSRHELKSMLTYGLPLVPSGLGGWMLVMADRWILLRLMDTNSVGVYSLGYKFGMVIQGILVGPIQLAWLPFLFATARQDKARETYTRVFTYFLLVALFAALALSALGEELVVVMARPEFHDAHKVIPLVALSYVLYGCYFQLAAGIYLEGKTKYMALLMGVGAVVNVALNFALIPHYGIMGSAVATLIAYALLPVGAYVISQRYYRIDYEWDRVIKVVLVVVLIYVASIFVGSAIGSLVTTKWPKVLIGGGLKVLLLLAYPILLYAIRFFRPEEVRLAKQLIRSAPAYVAGRLGRKPSFPDGPGNVGQ